MLSDFKQSKASDINNIVLLDAIYIMLHVVHSKQKYS